MTRTVPRLPANLKRYISVNLEEPGERGYLEIGEETQICRNFVRCGAERSQWGEDINVDLARIGLRRDWVRVRETRHLCNQSIEFLHLFIVKYFEGKERHVKPGAPCHGRRQTE